MKILNKVVLVYDIETFPNVFSCIVKNSETNEQFVFELSHRTKNIVEEATKMVDLFLDKQYMFCGYNNIHFDNPIMNFIIANLKTMPDDYQRVCSAIFKLAQLIINSETTEGWKQWKYANNFETLDLLTMMFSQKLRVGLKELQVTMQYNNVQEYEGDFDSWLPDEEIDKMLGYNLNDVNSTLELLNRCQKDIDLRIGIQEEFGVNVLSKDGMTIGMEILKAKYLEKTKKSWQDIKDLRSPCDYIDLNNVILPFIKYDTPILQELLKEMKQQKVSPGRKGYEKHFLLGGVEVTVGVGGVHTKNEPEIIIPNKDEVLRDDDVNSLYPSLLISYGFIPPHLGKEFLEIYGQIREDRLVAKHTGQKIKNETYKLALNGLTGNLQNEYSWVYGPESVLQIRINGQLLLLMLAEKIIQAGGTIKQLNTDGALYLFPKNKIDELNVILRDWEKQTKLTLEAEEYEAFYQFAINDYLAIGKGYKETKDKNLIKQKGLFIDTVKLGKGMQPMIIPEALNRYFADGIPVEQTIRECKDINKFITYQKADKKFSVEYNDKLISRINRYYMSTNGSYLYKCKIENGKKTGYINMLKASGVTIVNNFSELKDFPTNINYSYYVAECKKIISKLENVQTKLF